jgi:hypothetical protein
MSADSCSAISTALHEPMGGTGPKDGVVYLLVAWDGEWPSEGLFASALPSVVLDAVETWANAVKGMRVLLYRDAGSRETPPSMLVFRTTVGARLALRFDVERIEDLVAFDVPAILAAGGDARATTLEGAHYLVCTHGKRDACCALHGNRVVSALVPYAGARVLRVSHLGGHRFAAVVVTAPDGLCFGRVVPEDAERFVSEHDAGRIYSLERLRGRSGFADPEQTAEVAHRVATGLVGIDEVVPSGATLVPAGVRVTLDVRGETVALDVTKESLPFERPGSCGEPHMRAVTLRASRSATA